MTVKYRNMFMLVFVLIILHNYNVNGSIRGSECIRRYNTDPAQDSLGEDIDCSNSPYVFKSGYKLPMKVHSLDLSMNNITNVEPWDLLRSSSMQELYLNLNKIKHLNNVFELPELRLLDLSDNLLEFVHEDTFKGIKKLEYLNLANNNFTTFDKLAFHHLSNLKEIILDYNNIGQSLREVNLFDRDGFGLTHKITSISIKGVNLNEVPENFFTDAYDLKKLVIANNNLSEIFELPFTLEYLDLSDNPIPVIVMEDFEDLPSLKELKLNNLQIKEVPDYVFSPLHSLVNLELCRNRFLVEFSPLAFGREVLEDADDFMLEKLSLKGSRLTMLDETLLQPFGQLIRLDLQGNPWRCDCRLMWLKKLQIQPQDYQELRCATPMRLQNSKIFELEAKKLTCPLQAHIVGLSITVIGTCVVLATIALWVYLFLPKYQSRHSALQSMYSSSTAYTVLPLAATDPYDRRNN
ncbi:slit homolog 1 protein-like [Pectinophora gossypiella]|uniref:slit homolog 1 protein-like n=1 Tax=Pectinophora gossypiella TaxID=13191 RepID=UPI00214F42DB|nr:slit homolog 1 protein-like [Pectinophora gossypiella]